MRTCRALAVTRARPRAATLPYPIDPHAPLTLYTSGSSGSPKPIRKTLAQFNAEVHTLETQWGALVGDATMLASVPHHHIYGLLFRVLWPLAAGPRVRSRALHRTAAICRRASRNAARAMVVSTPAQLSRWPALTGFAALTPGAARVLFVGRPARGGRRAALRRAFGARADRNLRQHGNRRHRVAPAGSRRDAWQPLTGIEVRRDDDGALEVRSPHLGHDDWHRTDDAIAFDADGRFRLQGRLDRVLKLDGKRVSLPELEARLALHPYVAQAARRAARGRVARARRARSSR